MPEWRAFIDVELFMETGGDVLVLIGAVLVIMWTLMLERAWYFWRIHPSVARRVQAEWDAREDHASWYAHKIRKMLISRVTGDLERGLPMIRALVALCPLFGLLGTVTGMIEVFDVMAVAGTGNARAMASGVSRATIPTMAGMVAALSGLMISVQIDKFASTEEQRMADRLIVEHE